MSMETCRLPLHPLAYEGILLFNQGEYFEAHEALETAWRQETGSVRDLYRGILQVAVAYYHIRNGNYNGARKLLDRCKPWLAPFPPICRGVNVAALRSDVEIVEREIVRLGEDRLGELDQLLLKPVEYGIVSSSFRETPPSP